ncbi:hypothetical protein MPOCJGCO_4427 [Methylobacterium trifolii]|uniref:AprE-like long alpha-helical hairpin domain-containing protein n=1 Tax=Methylobacterium trifolii TaxID=1003092 RepID=A0ABQ4U4B1_9HYPH|nr:hypothetical protein MPOCJGCO_4427 [Methylobacterium trifolii]
MATLVAKGLAVAPRQYLLERTAAEIESKQLDLDTAILRAKQEMTKAERSIIDFRNDRRREILSDLQLARARRAEAEQRSETARTLVYEAETIAPRLIADRIRSQRVVPVYSLVRQSHDGPRTIPATDSTLLEPGDVVKVDSNEADTQASAMPGPVTARETVVPRTLGR